MLGTDWMIENKHVNSWDEPMHVFTESLLTPVLWQEVVPLNRAVKSEADVEPRHRNHSLLLFYTFRNDLQAEEEESLNHSHLFPSSARIERRSRVLMSHMCSAANGEDRQLQWPAGRWCWFRYETFRSSKAISLQADLCCRNLRRWRPHVKADGSMCGEGRARSAHHSHMTQTLFSSFIS